MKLKPILVGAFIAGFAMGGCDSSTPKPDKTRSDLAAVTTGRDGLKTQLETKKTIREVVASVRARFRSARAHSVS
jgi:hypothetical protein